MKNFAKSGAFLLICTMLCALLMLSVSAAENSYYVRQGATGTGTAGNPLGSIELAIKKLDGLDGTLVICGEYDLSGFSAREWQGMVTITGADDNSVLMVDDGNAAVFYGDVTLRDIKLDIGNDAHIDSVGSKLVYDPGDDVFNQNGYIHCGAYGNVLVDKIDYVHESGHVFRLIAAGAYVESGSYGVEGDANYTINGGEITSFSIDSAGYLDTHTGIIIGGNFNIVQNGGTLHSVSYYEPRQPIIMGALQMIFNNGTPLPELFYPEAVGGTYIIKSQTGGTVTPTETAGVFNIKANDGKVARIAGELVYDGNVVFNPGQTNVSWVDGVQEDSSANVIYNGACGKNVNWTLYDDGKLIISGKGEITENSWQPCSQMIKSVVIETGVTSVPDFAFSYCSTLADITIPEGVTYIGEAAFSYCNNLSSVEIPDSVTSISENCFFYCKNLESVAIGKGASNIEIGAFDGCEKLSAISVNSDNAYYSSDSAGVLLNKEKNCLVRCPEGKSGEYVIPATVKHIDRFAFYDCAELTKIVVPEEVEDIEWRTFAGCSTLAEINIPESVIHISEQAFMGCSALSSIVIPDGVTTIEYNAFYNCEKLAKIEIPDSVTYIGEHAFSGCPNLRIHGHPSSFAEAYANQNGIPFLDLRVIASGGCGENLIWMLYDTYELVISGEGEMADFGPYEIPWSLYCNSIKTVTINSGVTSVGAYAFHGCENLENAVLPESINTIGKYAFYSCKKLSEIEIPEGVVSVGAYAFSRCENLAHITIPDSVKSVGAYAFSNCTGLENVVISKSLTNVERYTFSDCTSLRKAVISSGSSLDRYAFSGCYNLTIEEIKNVIPGDVTCDGKVNRMDLLRLGKHFTGWEVEIDPAAADVTGDGKVNRMDLLRLGKYFTGWDVILEKA